MIYKKAISSYNHIYFIQEVIFYFKIECNIIRNLQKEAILLNLYSFECLLKFLAVINNNLKLI